MLAVLVVSLTLPLVNANPFATLSVWPVGSVDTGEPIVTTTPAELMVYNIDGTHIPIDPSWILLATNAETRDHIVSVTTNAGVTYTKSDFLNVFDADKIPPLSPTGAVPGMSGVTWGDLIPGYPGSENSEQYATSAVKDKLGIPNGGALWWAIKDSNLPPITDVPQTIKITVTMDAGVTDLKIMVLILGFWNGVNATPCKFNVHSPFTRSTILIAPEVATIALAFAPLSAYGLYKLKTRKKQN